MLLSPLHHSFRWLLFNINVQQTLLKYPLLTALPAERHHCLYCAQTTHFKLTSKCWLAIMAINPEEGGKLLKYILLICFYFSAHESSHSVSDRSSIVQWHLLSQYVNTLHQLGLRFYLAQQKYCSKQFHFSLNVMKVVVSLKKEKPNREVWNSLKLTVTFLLTHSMWP